MSGKFVFQHLRPHQQIPPFWSVCPSAAVDPAANGKISRQPVARTDNHFNKLKHHRHCHHHHHQHCQKQWWTPAGHGRAGVGRGEIEWRELAKTRWHFCKTFKFDCHLTVSRLSPHCVPTFTSLCLDFNLTVPYFQHIVTPLSLHFHPRNPLDPFTKWINFFKCFVLGVIETKSFGYVSYMYAMNFVDICQQLLGRIV